jgi:hypothetical protein
MPHWNGIVSSGTADELAEFRRRPVAFRNALKRLAREHGSELCRISWQQGADNWDAYVTVSGGDGRAFLERVQARDVEEFLSAEDKERESEGGGAETEY